jgi:hypothetical protein
MTPTIPATSAEIAPIELVPAPIVQAFPETKSVSGPPVLPSPRLDDIRLEDLRDAGRLLDLHGQAAQKGLVGGSEADRLKFVALAEHARVVGKTNPPGLFAALLRRGAFAFITQAEEEAARRRLKAYIHPAPQSVPGGGPARPPRKVLSEDARMVREVKRALEAAGYRGDPFPQIRRLDSTWTRARWDAAMAEVADLGGLGLRG